MTTSPSIAFIPIYEAYDPEPPLPVDELMALLKQASRTKRPNPFGRRRVHPQTSSLVGARPGRGQRARRPVAAGRIRKIFSKLLRAFRATAGVAGRARNHAGSVLQQSAQGLRASFRRSSSSGTGAAAATAASTDLTTPGGMKTAFVQSVQDALKHSIATAAFSGASFSLQELDDCLGTQTRRPMRSLVTGLKLALGTVLPDPTRVSARDAANVPKFDPLRAALRNPDAMLHPHFDALLHDFPDVEDVYARLTPWGNGESMEQKLEAMTDAASQAGSTPPVYFLVYRAAPLRNDIQYARDFLEALVARLGTASSALQ